MTPHDPAYCKSCRTQPAADGATRCEACAAARRAADAAKRAEARAKHRCLTCGAKALKARRYCATHLEYYRARSAAQAEARR